MFECIRCNKPLRPGASYSVTAPLCLGSVRVSFCPDCFQSGIDAGEIVWLGSSPYGICSVHEHAETEVA